MNLKSKKIMAGKVMGCSRNRIKITQGREDEVKEAVTKADIRTLINQGAITRINDQGVSRARANVIRSQKIKGKRKGRGSRKASTNSRSPRKEEWMARVRLQRSIIKGLHDNKKLENKDYRNLYNKVKGGYFRSKRHLKLYITESEMVKKE